MLCNNSVVTITRAEIEQAQKVWGDGIVEIGSAYADDGDYVTRAEQQVDTLYAYAQGTVLFKPTKASVQPFRGTRDAALSYFVGGNDAFAEDKGFALQPWTKVRFENTGFVLGEDHGLAMGHYFFTDTNGGETKVEYSFGYVRDADGKLRINLHHSSLPFAP